MREQFGEGGDAILGTVGHDACPLVATSTRL
jgi:hypothetical protein